jgi:hypothetical protein
MKYQNMNGDIFPSLKELASKSSAVIKAGQVLYIFTLACITRQVASEAESLVSPYMRLTTVVMVRRG